MHHLCHNNVNSSIHTFSEGLRLMGIPVVFLILSRGDVDL